MKQIERHSASAVSDIENYPDSKQGKPFSINEKEIIMQHDKIEKLTQQRRV